MTLSTPIPQPGGPGFNRQEPLLAGAQLGVEVGSLSTFFSMQHPSLGRLELVRSENLQTQTVRRLTREVRMADAHLLIEEVEEDNARTLTVTALSESVLMDAVLRFEFSLATVTEVQLGGKVVPWKRENRYHQAEACAATVVLKNTERWMFLPEASELPAGMSLLTYLRDEPDRWILHIRARAQRPDVYSLRGCWRWYNQPFPGWVQAALARAPKLAAKLLYLRERVSQRIPIQANGGVRMQAGEKLSFKVQRFAVVKQGANRG